MQGSQGDGRSTQAQRCKRIQKDDVSPLRWKDGKGYEVFVICPVLPMAPESGVTRAPRTASQDSNTHRTSHRAPERISRPVRFSPPSSSGTNASKPGRTPAPSSIQGSAVGESRQWVPDTFMEGQRRCPTRRRPISADAASTTQPSHASFDFCEDTTGGREGFLTAQPSPHPRSGDWNSRIEPRPHCLRRLTDPTGRQDCPDGLRRFSKDSVKRWDEPKTIGGLVSCAWSNAQRLPVWDVKPWVWR